METGDAISQCMFIMFGIVKMICKSWCKTCEQIFVVGYDVPGWPLLCWNRNTCDDCLRVESSRKKDPTTKAEYK